MDPSLLPLLARIADALERLAPPPPGALDLSGADAFVWHPDPPRLSPVHRVSRVELGLLQGIERQKRLVLDNTLRFARGLPANNAMLWGARGMGKSSLVKAAHAEANREQPGALVLIEIHREDIKTLPDLLNLLRAQTRRRDRVPRAADSSPQLPRCGRVAARAEKALVRMVMAKRGAACECSRQKHASSSQARTRWHPARRAHVPRLAAYTFALLALRPFRQLGPQRRRQGARAACLGYISPSVPGAHSVAAARG